jgi:ferrochelatase
MPVKSAVLLTNLGTPERLERAAIRRFLQEFLSDPLVVGLPRLLWLPLLYGVILPFRSSKTLAAYSRVWGEHGSPLMDNSLKQQASLQHRLGEHARVALAMRYGKPSFETTLKSLLTDGIEKLVVLPLYPQFSNTTTETTRVHLDKCLSRLKLAPAIEFIDSYHDHPAYIEALAKSVRDHWQQHQHHLLISFHGLPQVNVERGDPYQEQCEASARLLAEKLGLDKSQWSIGYQSRFGRQTWIQPYTADVLQGLVNNGIKAVDVICPGFSVDCLETLDEIQIEYGDFFMQHGGEQFHYIAALNDDASHIEMMRDLVQPYLAAAKLSAAD